METHLETHHLAQRRLQLLSNPLGHTAGRNAPGLGVANQLAARRGPAVRQRGGVIAKPTPHGQRNLGQLRGLARAGLATHDDDLVRRQRGHDFLAPGGDGQVFGEVDAQGGGGMGGVHWGIIPAWRSTLFNPDLLGSLVSLTRLGDGCSDRTGLCKEHYNSKIK